VNNPRDIFKRVFPLIYKETNRNKFKNKRQLIVLKTITGLSPNYALSIHVTYRPSRSCETVSYIDYNAFRRSVISAFHGERGRGRERESERERGERERGRKREGRVWSKACCLLAGQRSRGPADESMSGLHTACLTFPSTSISSRAKNQPVSSLGFIKRIKDSCTHSWMADGLRWGRGPQQATEYRGSPHCLHVSIPTVQLVVFLSLVYFSYCIVIVIDNMIPVLGAMFSTLFRQKLRSPK
jgi:hypothetical protein